MLTIENLSFHYRKSQMQIFDNFSLQLSEGGVYGLLGRNGAGKSTLIYLMTGLLTPDSGKVMFNGKDVRRRLPSTLSDIFVVPEEFDLPDVKLEDYVAINAPFYPNFSEDDLNRYLEIFDMTPDAHLRQLSMGQKKKVYMSFALATNTSLLIMDEPTNGLDIPGKSQFRKFIATGMSDQKTVIISTHQVRDIDTLLDHITIIDQSRTLLNSSTTEIAQRLRFGITDDISDALYVQPTIGGNLAVKENADGSETPIDLELLFNATLVNRERINEIFTR